MEFFGFAITALAAILTYQAWKNGQWMKQAHQDSQDFLKEMRKESAEFRKESAEFFKKMDERSERMDERAVEHSKILERMDARAVEHSKILKEVQESGRRQAEILKEIQASGERIEETQRYIAELVRIEGEKTRTLISHTH
jgi:uncharacterized membrane-anchored protein YhcB (DUF1043 family)